MTTRKVTINGKEKEAVWVDKQGEWGSHWEVDGIQFEGHINLWSFTYEPKTYLKESELSGDEWRKGGQVKIFRDGVCVYNEFSRTTDNAMRRIMINLPKLQEFDFDYLKVGRKIYNHDVPCTITRVLDDGEFMCETEDGSDVPWASKIESIKNGEMTRNEDEWKNQDRVHILSEHIWWFRK